MHKYKEIIYLVVLAVVLTLVATSNVVLSSNSPVKNNDLSLQWCTSYVYTDVTIVECSPEPPRYTNNCEESCTFNNGKLRCTMNCVVQMDGTFNSPLPPPTFSSPLPVQEVTVQEVKEAEPKPDHCFAFGFPCTDLNPGAQEGCICFCDAPMYCPK